MSHFNELDSSVPGQPAEGRSEPEPIAGNEAQWMQQADQARRFGRHEDALKFYSRAVEINKALVEGCLGQVKMLILLD